MKEFSKRTLTALIYASIFIFSLYINEYVFATLIGIIYLLCFYEYLILFNSKKNYYLIGGQLIIGLLLFSIYYFNTVSIHINYIEIVITCVVFLVNILLLLNKSNFLTTHFRKHLFGYIYTLFPFIIFLQLAYFKSIFNPNIIMGIVLLVWCNDSFSYIFGSIFGKHKLFKSISPKKTWEGSIGGGICTLLFATAIPFYLDNPFTNIDWWIIAFIIVVFGGYGDLIQSSMKRQQNTKDSSNLLPGHGGLLDRFDALIYSTPFIAFYLMFFKNLSFNNVWE